MVPEVMRDKEAKETCIAIGHPQPTVIWYYNNSTRVKVGYVIIIIIIIIIILLLCS
jgi:hypothetical protein